MKDFGGEITYLVAKLTGLMLMFSAAVVTDGFLICVTGSIEGEFTLGITVDILVTGSGAGETVLLTF